MIELMHAVVASALWLGVFLLMTGAVNRKRGRSWFDPVGVPAAYVAFVMAQVLALKGLDLVGLLTVVPVVVAFLGAGGTAWLLASSAEERRPEMGPGSDDATPRVALVIAVVVVTALAVFALVTPPHVWDVQAYHMPMVANYVQNESLASWPAQDLRQVFRVNAGELQMASLAILSRSDAAVALPNLLALGVSLVLTFLIARTLFGKHPVAWLAMALVLTAPQILYGAVTAKNDIAFMALVLCAFHWTLQYTTDPSSRPITRLALAGAAAGAAVATKVMGLNVVGAVGLVLLFLAFRRRIPWRAPFVFGGASLVVTLLLVGDVYWGNLQQAGDVPVGTAPGEIYFRSGILNLTSAAQFYLYDLSFKRLVTPQIFEHDFSHYGYFFPFLLVLGFVGGLRAGRGRGSGGGGLGILAALTLVLFISVIAVRTAISWDQRFMIWMVPSFALLASAFRDRLGPQRLLVMTTFAAAFAIGNLLLMFTNASDGIFARSAIHLASTGERARLIDVNPERYAYKIDGFARLDAAAQAGDSVLYVGWEDTWMYPAWGPRFTRYVRGVSGPADARDRVLEGDYRFVVVEDDSEEALKDATVRAVRRAGYSVLDDAVGRIIFERSGRDGSALRDLPPASDP